MFIRNLAKLLQKVSPRPSKIPLVQKLAPNVKQMLQSINSLSDFWGVVSPDHMRLDHSCMHVVLQ